MKRHIFTLLLLLVLIILTSCAIVDNLPVQEQVEARPTEEIKGEFVEKYVLQIGSPIWLPNFSHSDLGCNWSGFAGQVFDKDANPVASIVVEVGGTLEGNPVSSITMTGISPVYGPGGYEITLTDHIVDSINELWVQLHSLEGVTLSRKYYFNTYAVCEKNLVIINFAEKGSAGAVNAYYFLPITEQNLP